MQTTSKNSQRYYITRQIAESVRANFAAIYLRGMRDRSMRSGTGFSREIQLIGQHQGTCLAGYLEYKYHVIFVLVLDVICTLRSAVG